jgi:hypothetical protein
MNGMARAVEGNVACAGREDLEEVDHGTSFRGFSIVMGWTIRVPVFLARAGFPAQPKLSSHHEIIGL